MIYSDIKANKLCPFFNGWQCDHPDGPDECLNECDCSFNESVNWCEQNHDDFEDFPNTCPLTDIEKIEIKTEEQLKIVVMREEEFNIWRSEKYD